MCLQYCPLYASGVSLIYARKRMLSCGCFAPVANHKTYQRNTQAGKRCDMTHGNPTGHWNDLIGAFKKGTKTAMTCL